MKILKLLNKTTLSIILFFFLLVNLNAEDKPADIWNIDQEKTEVDTSNNDSTGEESNKGISDPDASIYKMQSQNKNNFIKLEEGFKVDEIKIFGLYDPEDYDLDINMWSNSDGDQLKNIFSKLDKIDLSNDATEIMKISLLTNAYLPNKNISEKDFFKFRSDWLIKNSFSDIFLFG